MGPVNEVFLLVLAGFEATADRKPVVWTGVRMSIKSSSKPLSTSCQDRDRTEVYDKIKSSDVK